MRRLLLAVVLVGALAGCDAAIDLEELPTDAPFGLTEIDIPNSEAEIIAAIQAMPAEFDGRQRAGPGHLGASYGETGIFWSISALPASDPVVRDRSGSSAEWVVRQAGLELSGVLEDHALSLDGVVLEHSR